MDIELARCNDIRSFLIPEDANKGIVPYKCG
jgi:hypothetical protein